MSWVSSKHAVLAHCTVKCQQAKVCSDIHCYRKMYSGLTFSGHTVVTYSIKRVLYVPLYKGSISLWRRWFKQNKQTVQIF